MRGHASSTFESLGHNSSGAITPFLSSAAILPRALTSKQMVANINTITTMSQNLQPIAASIPTGENAIFRRQDDSSDSNPFEAVIDGFEGIISTASTDVTAMKGTKPYGKADAEAVCSAFSDFVVVHQDLLKIVIGKSGILESLFLEPVAGVLRSLESVVDTLAFGIIAAVPACEASATKNKENLDTTIGQAVCAYSPGGTLGITLLC